MQIQHTVLPRTLMQAINILRYYCRYSSTPFKGNQPMMRLVRLRLHKRWITQLTARPITLPPTQVLHKSLMLYRLRSLPSSSLVSVVGNPRGGANACAADNYHPAAIC
jgi:hypothetical protein